MAGTVNVDQFISQAAGQGPCVGIVDEAALPFAPPAGFEIRTIEGAHTKSRAALYDAFAEAWHFPPWFGRNMDAFDDFMCDLDNMIDAASGKPPAPGYLTVINHAHLVLIDQPELLSWFASCMPYYRNYYRDEASPPAVFGLLLSVPIDQLQEVRERWLTANVPVATVTV
jgi:Barstar (barnase inhibitor)